jgi:hypothetical protein
LRGSRGEQGGLDLLSCLAGLRPWWRELAHLLGNVRLREAGRQQLFDLALAHARSGTQQLEVVVVGEMGSEQGHAWEVQLPGGEEGEDCGEIACCTGSSDALEGLIFGEMENIYTIAKHGGAGDLEIEPAGVDLAKVGDEVGGEVVVIGDEAPEGQEELGGRELGERGKDVGAHGSP